MYEAFYRLRQKPFALNPDSRYLYLGRRHRHALTMLEYAIGQAAGFAVVTGEIGCGKTTIVQRYLEHAPGQLRVGYLSNTHPGMEPLLAWLLESLGVTSTATRPNEIYREFVALLKRETQAGRRTLLVIDEAQNLSLAALEELRVLSNLNVGTNLLLQTVLIGQPELRAKLSEPGMRQFAQRIVVDYHLVPLEREETHAYVAHRLSVAGGSPLVFRRDALDRVHDSSEGVPRLINILCDTALVYGFAEQRSTVDLEVIEQVLSDRAGGVLPVKVSGQTAPATLLAE